MTLFSATTNNTLRSQQPFILLQSSTAQSGIPLLRQVLTTAGPSAHVLLFCFIYPSTNLLKDASAAPPANIHAFDLLDSVPGYSHDWSDSRMKILSDVEMAPPGPIQVFIDSVDTLCSDIGSVSETFKFLSGLLKLVRARPGPSRLVLHASRPSQLIPLLTQPTFSPSFVSLIAHPVALLNHLATEYLTFPPPFSPKEKFWNTFIPLSERIHEVERLVYGSPLNGEGCGGISEIVCEILVRDGESRKRGIERELEGWSTSMGPCEVLELESLKRVRTKKTTKETEPDPTQNVSFNLNLTSSQQELRARVPLPYAHEGNPIKAGPGSTAAILYDPDSADDIDDDDPDEDLDI